MTEPRIYVAIAIGAAATWPALFLYKRVLKLMAFLQDWQEREGGYGIFSCSSAATRLGYFGWASLLWFSSSCLSFLFHHRITLNGTGKRVRAFLLLHALRAGSGFLSTDAGARHHARATSSTS